jgi:hypothetical protein
MKASTWLMLVAAGFVVTGLVLAIWPVHAWGGAYNCGIVIHPAESSVIPPIIGGPAPADPCIAAVSHREAWAWASLAFGACAFGVGFIFKKWRRDPGLSRRESSPA